MQLNAKLSKARYFQYLAFFVSVTTGNQAREQPSCLPDSGNQKALTKGQHWQIRMRLWVLLGFSGSHRQSPSCDLVAMELLVRIT
jgi:hypothetical protein